MDLYTNLEPGDFKAILQLYEIGNLISYKPLSGGAANTNYLVKTNEGYYVLTISDNKSFEETQMLTDVLSYLKDNQFRTSQVVPNNEGTYVTRFNNKPVILKPFISGTVSANFTNDVLVKLGRELATLHRIPAPDYLPKSFPYGEHAFKSIDERYSSHPFIKWLEEKHEYIKKSLLPDLPKSLIHGDLFYSNVVINENQEPVIIDYEEACYYYRIFDLGMAAVGLCCENGQINLAKTRAFIQGYRQVNDLSTMEREHIKAFMVYGAVATAFWRFRQFNILFPSAELADSNIEMKNIADQIFSIPNNQILNES